MGHPGMQHAAPMAAKRGHAWHAMGPASVSSMHGCARRSRWCVPRSPPCATVVRRPQPPVASDCRRPRASSDPPAECPSSMIPRALSCQAVAVCVVVARALSEAAGVPRKDLCHNAQRWYTRPRGQQADASGPETSGMLRQRCVATIVG